MCKAEIDTDVESERVDTKRERAGEMNWGFGTDIYTLLTLDIKQ